MPTFFCLRVGSQLFHVDLRHDLQHIAELVPAFVEDDVLEAVLRGEIDVVLVGLRVDAGFEIHAVDIVGVPPVPGDFARFDPRRVRHLRRLFEQLDQRVRDQIPVVLRDAEHAPRKGARSARDGDVVGAFNHLEVAIAGQIFFQRIGRESRVSPLPLVPRSHRPG